MKHLAVASLADPGDRALSLMLARACERVGWADLAWVLFDQVEASSSDPSTSALAAQGKAGLERPLGTLEGRLMMAPGGLAPAALARARGEAREGETALSWLIRQDTIPFDRVLDVALAGLSLPAARASRDRLGMRLLAERRITQGDLKHALSQQAQRPRPLGEILVQEFGLSPAVLQDALKAQGGLPARLGAADAPAALLMRWGALRRDHWEAAMGYGAGAFERLAANGHVLAANVRRADTYRKVKLRLMAEGRFRLGEELIAQGTLDRETLAKALAWQVDQPYPLGELLIRRRLASVEQVVEGLMEQARRYDEATEAMLPPVEQPPPPALEIADAPAPPSRRHRWLLVMAGISLVGAVVFATRYSRGDFAWLTAFVQGPEASTTQERGVAELLGGTQASGPRRERGTAFDPLDLPDSEFSSQPLAGALGEGMVGERLDEGFVGSRVSEGFVGAPLPEERLAGSLSEASGLEAVGVPSGEQAVGTSGVTDSVAYGRQASSGAKRGETSREAELQALARVLYPMQQERHMPGAPSESVGGRMQAPAQPDSGLQAPIALGRTVDGSPPESIQVRRDTAVFRLRLGRSLYERQDTASAREEFLSAIALDPTLSPPHYYLGRIAEARGDRDVAAKWYRSYLARASGGEHSDEVRERLKGLPN